MATYDLTPLFRSTIGFDRLGRLLEASLTADPVAYPPYNIEKLGENAYRITMAVAGFGEGDIDITAQDNALTIRGKAQPVASTCLAPRSARSCLAFRVGEWRRAPGTMTPGASCSRGDAASHERGAGSTSPDGQGE